MGFEEFWNSEKAVFIRRVINDDDVARLLAEAAYTSGKVDASNEAREMIDAAFGGRISAMRERAHGNAQN